MTWSKIAGTGGYLPERVITNKELEKSLDTSDEWIRERSGIKRRHIAAKNETTSDMGLAAAKKAIDAAEIEASEIDLIILATSTPDKLFPASACSIQRQLGIANVPAFDVNAACSGFLYALDIANRFVRTEGASCALVIGSETYSRILDWTDRSTCVLFGDGAGAVILRAAEEPGILSTHIHSDGQFENLLHVPAGISSGYDTVRKEAAFIQMKGNEVFRKAVSTLGSIARETLSANNVEKKDIAWGFDANYKTPKYGKGQVRTYYMNERNVTSKNFYEERPSPTIERERYGIEWRHKWDVDKKTYAILQYVNLSDGEFLKDYFENVHKEDSSPNTFFLLNRVCLWVSRAKC